VSGGVAKGRHPSPNIRNLLLSLEEENQPGESERLRQATFGGGWWDLKQISLSKHENKLFSAH